MIENSKKGNIILIGMPACGKSTVGVILAKKLGLNFIDTDILLMQRERQTLTEIIKTRGVEGLLKAESELGQSLEMEGCVVATGGSMALSATAMESLASQGVVVWITADLDEIAGRIGDIRERGVAAAQGESVGQIYASRAPYYEHYANIKVQSGASAQDTADRIIALL